jgi:hypothetical protein
MPQIWLGHSFLFLSLGAVHVAWEKFLGRVYAVGEKFWVRVFVNGEKSIEY